MNRYDILNTVTGTAGGGTIAPQRSHFSPQTVPPNTSNAANEAAACLARVSCLHRPLEALLIKGFLSKFFPRTHANIHSRLPSPPEAPLIPRCMRTGAEEQRFFYVEKARACACEAASAAAGTARRRAIKTTPPSRGRSTCSTREQRQPARHVAGTQ